VTLHKAVLDGLLPRNVCRAVRAARVQRKEVSLLSLAQVRALLEAAHGDRNEALYVLAVHSGLRQGELLGLKWSDVDFETATLSV
jgi:integrase